MKFRKKPIIIEAVQWTGDMTKVIELVGHDLPTYGEGKNGSLRITTLEGDHEVSPEDWILRGIKGEFYPCKPDIFMITYDLVDENPTTIEVSPLTFGLSNTERLNRILAMIMRYPAIEEQCSAHLDALKASMLELEKEMAQVKEQRYPSVETCDCDRSYPHDCVCPECLIRYLESQVTDYLTLAHYIQNLGQDIPLDIAKIISEGLASGELK